MNSMLRVMAACNRVKPGNPAACTDSAEALLLSAAASSPDLVLLPACALSSASCGDLFSSGELLDAASDQLGPSLFHFRRAFVLCGGGPAAF